GPSRQFADQARVAFAVANPHADCSIPPRLPRNVWVQTNEAWIANEIEVRRQIAHDLSRKERRAHPLQAVRIIDADPEDHRDPECRPGLKSALPRTFKYSRPLRSQDSMVVKTFEFSSVDGRRFVKPTDRWINLRVDHNSTVTLISELGDRQASVDFRFTANYHASEAVVRLIQIE